MNFSKGSVVVIASCVCLTMLVIVGFPRFADAGEIYGCVSSRNGTLRIVSDVSQCTSKETGISWNQTGPKGDTGADGHSPVVSMSGDQITVDGVITGPHLTGPAGSISGVSAIAYAVVEADGSTMPASPGLSVSKVTGESGHYTITLPQGFNTVFPTRPACTVSSMNPFTNPATPIPTLVTCALLSQWGTGFYLGVQCGIQIGDGFLTPVDSPFDIICVQ